MRLNPLREFLDSEAAGGVLLMAAAALALMVANSPLAPAYFHALHAPLLGLDLLHWVNDGLMALFFLYVTLELKREFLVGELSTWSKRALPGVAAFGGMLLPALIYVGINLPPPPTLRGWAIPAATDIAFALGAMALLGSRVPSALKLFLMALAVLDDLGAILIIALFYTAQVSPPYLAGAAAAAALLFALARLKVGSLWPYLLVGAVLWVMVLKSGVHATLAGVVLGFAIPLGARPDGVAERSPLGRLEHGLSPWIAFLVVPVFGFANAGVSFSGVRPTDMLHMVPLGISVGLVLGKTLGVFAFSYIAIATGIAKRPDGVSWPQLFGAAAFCGIGFTMSLFIGDLAFVDPVLQPLAKLGVMLGSVVSALLGLAILGSATGGSSRVGSAEMMPIHSR
jgi:NhaA family Na+:H+ antiporter